MTRASELYCRLSEMPSRLAAAEEALLALVAGGEER